MSLFHTLLSSSSSQPSSDTTSDGKQVFLIVGDSNAGDTSATTTLGPETLSDTCYLWNGTDLTEKTTGDINNAGATNGTAWKKFALDYNAATSKKVVFVNQAEGGSSFEDDGSGEDWSSDGDLYAAAKTEADACLAFLELTKLKGIFVFLGINDARGATALATIATAVDSLFDRLTTDFPDTPIYVISTGRDENSALISSRKFAIKKYLKDASVEYDDVELSANAYSFFPWGAYAGDNIHLLQTTGYNKLGEIQGRVAQETDTNKEVRQVYSYFHTPLSSAHKAAYKTFIEGCQSDGNWDLLDELQIYRGSTRNNVLISLKNVTAPLDSNFDFTENDCITGGSGKYLRTNFIPSVCPVVATVDDFICGVKTKTNATAAGTAAYLFGGLNTTAVRLLQASGSVLAYSCNDTTATSWTSGDTKFADETWYCIGRSAGIKSLFKNPTEVHSASVAVGAACTRDIYVCALNNDGSAATPIASGVYCWFYAKKTGFNLSAFQSRMDTLLTALGI